MKQRALYWAAIKKIDGAYDLRPHGPIRVTIRRDGAQHRVMIWDSRKPGTTIMQGQTCDTLAEAKAVGILRVRLETKEI